MWENKSNEAVGELVLEETRQVKLRCRCPPAISGRFSETREERTPTSPQASLVPTPEFLLCEYRPYCISPLCIRHKRPYEGSGVGPVRPIPKRMSHVQEE